MRISSDGFLDAPVFLFVIFSILFECSQFVCECVQLLVKGNLGQSSILLPKLNAQHLGVVLKIETQRAFEQLPNLLLEVMRSPCAGVMIARGDLAIECGWERMAEVQEEILWICEAAHMPVIWATQVLEKLTKEGLPSRAEITDAAMGERAECVMLNKGPYVVDAVRALDDILRRMENHQHKKRSMLRQLRLADQLSCITRQATGLVEVEEQMGF